MVTDSIFFSFWNVENLFDTENANRPEKIKKMIAKDLVGWNETILDTKLQQLSKVILSMNTNNGPDIIGLCEIENRNVLEKLVKTITTNGGREYFIAHADSSDNRGIDIAFLYDPDIAETSSDQMFQHWIVKRYATRELFQVNFTINGNKLVFIGNHWPSRTSGQYETEPYRMVAGETLSYWIERIHEELGNNVGIIIAGDFNDEPFNRSLSEYALSTNDQCTVLTAKNHYLFNMMWKSLSNGKGTLMFNRQWNVFDQIMVNKSILNNRCGWKVAENAKIEGTNLMSDPKTSGPRRFGIKPNGRDLEGYSDHFPISIILQAQK